MPKKKFRNLTDKEIKYVVNAYRDCDAGMLASKLEETGGGPVSKTQIYAIVRHYRVTIEKAIKEASTNNDLEMVKKLKKHKERLFPAKRRTSSSPICLSDFIDDLENLASTS